MSLLVLSFKSNYRAAPLFQSNATSKLGTEFNKNTTKTTTISSGTKTESKTNQQSSSERSKIQRNSRDSEGEEREKSDGFSSLKQTKQQRSHSRTSSELKAQRRRTTPASEPRRSKKKLDDEVLDNAKLRRSLKLNDETRSPDQDTRSAIGLAVHAHLRCPFHFIISKSHVCMLALITGDVCALCYGVLFLQMKKKEVGRGCKEEN
ncbi:transmembrane protein, putative [Medicago truncatula]|uniref:Transmembrane protein, putative n=1 Tax=Medicago truncatula TaxID=3880 RepID=A0A072UET4_MEDTR|nr:transmembrane protein, putative [Medicago truncatula]